MGENRRHRSGDDQRVHGTTLRGQNETPIADTGRAASSPGMMTAKRGNPILLLRASRDSFFLLLGDNKNKQIATFARVTGQTRHEAREFFQGSGWNWDAALASYEVVFRTRPRRHSPQALPNHPRNNVDGNFPPNLGYD